jgi:Zn-dependent peptidase ImmA (M78 family)/transcriptional regulator with XRE-family HTH domain
LPITEQELAVRLRQAREATGLTQEAVARKLGLSRPSLAQIELGNRSVSSLELDRLARLYGRSLDELLAEDFDAEATLVAIFRAEAAAEEDELLDTVNHAIELARELTFLEERLEIERVRLGVPAYTVAHPHTKWEAIQQGNQAAAAERKRLDLGDLPLGDVADLLESQGVRTALLPLPEDVSGLTLMDPSLSFFVVTNEQHGVLRRRFSWLHEYAHILFDRGRRGTVSRESQREELAEVRANAFAASFLVPGGGARAFLEELGKGRGSKERWELYHEAGHEEILKAESRPAAGSQRVQLYDVILLARRFGVSRLAAIYRLKNLGLISQAELDEFLSQEREGQGREIERSLGSSPKNQSEREQEPRTEAARESHERDFRGRFLSLALEAYRRDRISRGRLYELGRLVGKPRDHIDDLLDLLGFLQEDEEDEILRPDAPSGG